MKKKTTPNLISKKDAELTDEQKKENELTRFAIKNKDALHTKISKKEYDRRIANWQLFYLNNLDIFVEDVLEIPVAEFQKHILVQSMEYNSFNIVASRRLGKTLTISLLAISTAILMPNVQIVVTSMTLHQANLIIKEKIDEMFTSEKSTKLNSPILQQMRKDGWIKFVKNKDTGGLTVEFGNNSKIFAIACNEQGRGVGSNIRIGDESAILSENLYKRIIAPTGEIYKYKGFVMEEKEILMTSARTRDNWVWKRICSDVKEHFKTNSGKVGFFAGDIYTSIANGLQTLDRFKSAKKNSDDFTFLTEYLNIWLGESADSIFKYDDFHRAQKNTTAYYPKYLDYDFCDNPLHKELSDDWVKIISVDLAVVGGKQNDTTAIILGRLNLKTNERVIEYIYTANGMNSMKQVEVMKRLFYDYDAKYIIIDTKGLGNVIYDILTTKTLETEYFVQHEKIVDGYYPAWGVNTDKLLQISSDGVIKDKLNRVSDAEYEDVIIPFAGNPELNSQIHLSVWNALRNKNLTLLIPKSEKENKQNDKYNDFFLRNSNELVDFYLPYATTDMLINETIALDVIRRTNGQLSVKESDYKDVKDTYMSFAMWNKLADNLFNQAITSAYQEYEFNLDDFEDIYN